MSSDPTPLLRQLLNGGRAIAGRAGSVRTLLLTGWLEITGRFGSVQTLVLLTFFYVTLIGPVSILQALGRRDQLEKRGLWKDGSAWHASDTGGTDLERAKLSS